MFIAAVALGVSFAACQGNSKRTQTPTISPDCGSHPPSTDLTVTGRDERTPVVASTTAYADFERVLTAYYGARFDATYTLCPATANDGTIAGGHLRMVKDGSSRARVDTDFTLGTSNATVISIALKGDREIRAAECSDNLGAYYRLILGDKASAASAPGSPYTEFLNYGKACIDNPVDVSIKDVLTHGDPFSYFPLRLTDLKTGSGVYAYDLSENHRQVAGADAICFTYGRTTETVHEQCFNGDNVLVSGSWEYATHATTMVVTSIANAIKDEDFVPPYDVMHTSDECPGTTAWDRSKSNNPESAPVVASTGAEYHDALTRYFLSRYKVTYALCSHPPEGDGSPIDGTLSWIKDGTTRARFDLAPAGSPARGSVNDNEIFDRLGLGVPNSTKINLEDWKSIVEPSGGLKQTRTEAGLTGTCFLDTRNSTEECFSDDGVLLYAREGTQMTLRALSVSTAISPSDFDAPAGQ